MDFYSSVTQYKNKLLVTGYDNGKRVFEEIPYRPYLFTPDEQGDFHTIFGEPVSRVDFDSIWDARDFTKRYEDVHNYKIHGMSTWPYTYIYDNYKRQKKQYNRDDISVVGIDIETDYAGGWASPDTAENEVTAITISRNEQYVTLGLKDFDTKKSEYNVQYFKCKDETQLLRMFLKLWNSPDFSPDIVTGWHIDGYDIPYLINRITRVLGQSSAKKLSPFGILNSREVVMQGQTKILWTIVGVAIYDYLQLYLKFIVPNKGQPESKSLNYICEQELGEKKLDYSEYGDLDTLYRENPQMYYEYNVRDVFLVNKLDKRLGLINLAILMTYDAGVNYMDIFGTIRVWDALIHEYLMDRKTVVPYAKLSDHDFKIEGGHVKDPDNGQYDWVASVDLKSSYPHQIMQYNIGPETFVDILPGRIRADDFVAQTLDMDELTENGKYCVAGNGTRYRKDVKSFLSALMEDNFNKRKIYKNQMIEAETKAREATDPVEIRKWEDEASKYENMQHGTKIKLNAAYGALSNAYFRWFNPYFSEAITQSGQLAVKWGEKKVNEYINKVLNADGDYIIAIDTDSLYIHLGPLIRKFDPTADAGGDHAKVKATIEIMDKICTTKILPLIRQGYIELAEYMRAYAQKMDMNREVLANKAIWTGKKHYILNMYDKEGVKYDPPKKKIVGIEAVRSSTPNAAREKIKEGLDIILNGTESDLHSFVNGVRDHFKKAPIPDISFPRSASDINKWTDGLGNCKPSTPIQARAAINHNELLKTLKVHRFKPIASGEKIKFTYLVKFNPHNIPVIGFADIIPPEFKLENYVDRMKQFNKGFLNPLSTITDAIGWTTEPVATLDAFFV